MSAAALRCVAVVLAAALTSGAGTATADDSAEFVAACRSASNLDESVCRCLETKARGQLTPKGYEFLLASLRKDTTRTEELSSQLSPQELRAAGMFMVNTPGRCAHELSHP